MRRLEVLSLGLICSVVVLVIADVAILIENQELHHSYDELHQTYDELYQTYLSVVLPNLSFSPPISQAEAVHIALKYGGWNETSLNSMRVTTTLFHMKFYNSTEEYSQEILYQVKEPLSDYDPTRIGDVIYRYVWVIVVEQVGYIKSIPPPGLYYIDAATSEVIPTPLLL